MSGYLARNRSIILAYLGVLLLLAVTTIYSPGYLSESSLRSSLVLAAFVGIVALGQTFVIIGGGIDLSVPWVLNSSAVLMAVLCAGQDLPFVWVLPSIMIAAALLGALNGIGIAIFGIPAIIMTLGVNVILQGLIVIYTGGRPTPPAPEVVRFLSVGRIGPVPVVLILWVALGVAASWLLSKTAFGRYVYAVGSSATVAEFSGVPSARTTITTYVLSSVSAALAGILLTGYSGQAYLGMGDPYLFTSIAAVAIGGASILGGSGHYVGTVAGALVLTILSGLLPALGLSTGALMIVYGAVILLTVSMGSDALGGAWRAVFRWSGRKTDGTKS